MAGEYGATTGRPRRMGWFDAVASRYGCQIQGATDVVLTVLDCLGYLKEIPVCVGYEIDGEVVKEFPVTAKLAKAKQCMKCFRDGHVISPASKSMISFRKIAENILSLLKKNLVYRSQWYLTDQSVPILFTATSKIFTVKGTGRGKTNVLPFRL